VSRYVGLDRADLPACYRDRAQQIADGDDFQPVCALSVEFDKDGKPALALFGASSGMPAREQAALLLNAIQALAYAAEACNANASN